MTREEAIQILKSKMDGSVDTSYEWAETVRMAIEALRDCSEIQTGDLISRQDAIRWIKTECNPHGKPTLDFESGKKVIEHLKQMPSADRTEPGRWEIKQDTDEYGLKRPKLVCSKCEKEPAAWDLTELFEFCPNCGARMMKNGKG